MTSLASLPIADTVQLIHPSLVVFVEVPEAVVAVLVRQMVAVLASAVMLQMHTAPLLVALVVVILQMMAVLASPPAVLILQMAAIFAEVEMVVILVRQVAVVPASVQVVLFAGLIVRLVVVVCSPLF